MFKDKSGKQISNRQALEKIFNRFYNYLLDFELMVLRWVSHVPSHTFRKTFYQFAGMKIGKGSVVHMWANFFDPGGIHIGDDTIIGDHAFLDGRAPLTIGSHTDIASSVMIYNSEHDLESNDFSARTEPITIGDYVALVVGNNNIVNIGLLRSFQASWPRSSAVQRL